MSLLITGWCHGLLSSAVGGAAEPEKPLRAGIIGLDTSHVTAFTSLLNGPEATGDLAGVRVVAGYPGGSPDIDTFSARWIQAGVSKAF